MENLNVKCNWLARLVQLGGTDGRCFPGKVMGRIYLTATYHTFLNGTLIYDREFSLAIQKIDIDGIDMFTWNEAGKITEFKVMSRPYKALNMINDQMTTMLDKLRNH